MRMIEKEFVVPIYDVHLLVCACDDPLKRRKVYDPVFGEYEGSSFSGLCDGSGRGHFAIFIKASALDQNTVAHEVFHLTHRIMEYCGCNFDEDHHEQAAYLNGYLMELVCNALKVKYGR